MRYRQLTVGDRYIIECLLYRRLRQKDIAEVIGVHPSTISREIRRNKHEGSRYLGCWADRKAFCRRYLFFYRRRSFSVTIERRVESLLRQKLSPQQIVGYCKKINEPMVSPERIYQHIWRDKKKKGELYKSLRSYHWGKRKRLRLMQQPVPDRKFIDERPEVGKTFGDWEIDTMKGKQGRHSLLTMVDRYSKYAIIRKLPTYKPKFVSKVIVEELKQFGSLNRTITSDNGFEFADHKQIEQTLGVKYFFTHPYTFWEKGLCEQTNGLLRQYFPRKLHFRELRPQKIRQVMKQLNNRPRLSLCYNTPSEILQKIAVTN